MIPDGLDPVVVSRLTSQQVEQVTCIECCKYYIAPATADCGHTLCHGCWAGRHTCPICAAPLDRRALKLNKPMQILTEHVHSLGDTFEKLFGIKLDEFVVDILQNDIEKDPTKNVKEWLASSQNHFSAPVLNSQQSIQNIVNPMELSASKIQIHAPGTMDKESPNINRAQKTSCSVLKVISTPQAQDDWDIIEILPDTEDNVLKNKRNLDLMHVEPILIDDTEYTTDNPRRSSRKRDFNEDSYTHTCEVSVDKHSLKNSSGETDKKSAKTKQNWSNVKKMRKEFSKLNKKHRNKLNVSIEMCKKAQSAVNKPKPALTPFNSIALSQQACYKIDDNTPNIDNEKIAVTTEDTVTKISSDKLSNKNTEKATSVSNKANNNICMNESNQSTDQAEKHDSLQYEENSSNVNVKTIQRKKADSLVKNSESNQLTKGNELNINNVVVNSKLENDKTKSANIMPILKKSSLNQKTAGEDCIKITQTEVDSKTVNMNTDDIEISIKIGSTITNIFIKKKDKDVQLKVNTDREIQTSLGPYALPEKNDASCSPIRESNLKILELEVKNKAVKMTQLSKSTPTKKNTESADTTTAHFEITESVEKELSDLMECVETGNDKSKVALNITSKFNQIANSLQVKDMKVSENLDEVTEDIEHLNDLDIFGSGSVKEVNVQVLKSTKHAPSEILPTLKSKKSQKVTDKRDRDMNDEIEMPRNKKQKMDFDKIEEIPTEVSTSAVQEENQEVANDSELISYDAIMSQVFANIDADMKGQKNTQTIKHTDNQNKSPRMQITSKTQSAPENKDILASAEAGNTTNLKEFINQKYSENVFTMVEKDSEATDVTNKNVDQPPVRESTQKHIKNLLTPGMYRDLASSARDESQTEDDDVEMMEPKLGTPMVDHDDSDKSVVEETPQKNLSFSKSKQKCEIQNKTDDNVKRQRQEIKERHVSNSNSKSSDSQIIKSIINISDTSGASKQDTTVVEINKKKQTLETPISINKFVDQIKHNSTPVVRKSLNFESENSDDPEETLCTRTQANHSSEHTLCPTTTQEREFLAKAFEQTPISPVKRPLALRSRQNKVLCLAGSCLSSVESTNVKMLCRIRGWTYVDKYTNNLTHLVVGVDDDNKSQRSVKYMCALAASKWIVSYAWAEKCLQMKDIVDERPYEALDGSGDPGPRRSRTASCKLFEGFTFYCMPPFGILDIETLKYILEAAGARVVNEPQGVKVTPNGAPALLLAEPEHTQEDRFIYLAMQLSVVPVNYEWVLNCLGCYTLCSVYELLLCPSSLLPSATECWPAELLRERDDD